MASEMSLTVVYEWSEDGWWVAEIAEVPGAISHGRTKEEAKENVLDALNELLAYRRESAQREHKAEVEVVRLAS
jgi:predicted RNase H-like HicB family nuclease